MKPTEWEKKYREKKLVVISFILKTKKNGKKGLFGLPEAWQTITLENNREHINNHYNGMIMRTGTKTGKYYIIGIDIDNKDEEGKRNGMEVWKEQEERYGELNTLTQITGNGGMHKIVKVSEEVFDKLPTAITELIIDGVRCTIDMKGRNQGLIVEPSRYDGKSYNFEDFDKKIAVSPEWLNLLLLRHAITKLTKVNTREPRTERLVREKGTFDDTKFVSSDNLTEVLKLIPSDDRDVWLKVGYAIFNCNPDGFDLWVWWSKQSSKYGSDGYNVCKKIWNDAYYTKDMSVKYLYGQAKKFSPKEYEKLYGIEEKPTFKTQKIDCKYLGNNEDVMNAINKLFKSIQKCLSIKSGLGTGKSELMFEIIKMYNLESILWLCDKRILILSTHGKTKELGMVSYLDGVFDGKYQLCSIDSVLKIPLDKDGFIKQFDLIVFDESESLLNQMSSATLKEGDKRKKVFERVYYLCKSAKKIIAMDGDYGNRSHKFMSALSDEVSVIENKYKSLIKYFLFRKSQKKFIEDIIKDLEKGKKIVVASGSKNMAEFIAKKIPKKFKLIIHTSAQTQEEKDKLMDVNEYWTTCDILIYTPCVETGVSYTKKHFDKLYLILTGGSTSPRGAIQMTCRIRNFTDNNVQTLIKGLSTSTTESLWNSKELVELYKYLHDDENTTVKHIEMDGKIQVIKEIDLFSKILVDNEVENLNKNPHTFMTDFVRHIKKKGHTFEFVDETMDKVDIKEIKEERKTCMLNAEIIDDETMDGLMDELRKETIEPENKILIEKKLMMKTWGIKDVTQYFLDCWYEKEIVLRHFKDVVNIELILRDVDLKELDHYRLKQIEEARIVKEILDIFGFDIKKEKIIKREVFLAKMEECMKTCTFFKEKKYVNYILGKSKVIKTSNGFLGAINSLFSNFGLKIKRIVKTIKRKGKVSIESNYTLAFINGINEFVGIKSFEKKLWNDLF